GAQPRSARAVRPITLRVAIGMVGGTSGLLDLARFEMVGTASLAAADANAMMAAWRRREQWSKCPGRELTVSTNTVQHAQMRSKTRLFGADNARRPDAKQNQTLRRRQRQAPR